MISGLACRMCHFHDGQHQGAAQGEKVFLHRPSVVQLFYLIAEEVENQIAPGHAATAGDKGSPVLESLLVTLMRMLQRDITDQQFLLQEIPPHEPEGPILGDLIELAMQYLNTHFSKSNHFPIYVGHHLVWRRLHCR